jgi:hypothetical protein
MFTKQSSSEEQTFVSCSLGESISSFVFWSQRTFYIQKKVLPEKGKENKMANKHKISTITELISSIR